MTLIVTLLVVGAILLFLETLLPGIITGTLGMLCLGTAVALGYTRFGAGTGHVLLALVLVGLLAGTWGWLKYFPGSRMARPFISQGTVGDLGNTRSDLLHRTGTALSPLRPSGMASIDGTRVDVVTEGPWIEPGTLVRVIAVEGIRVVVRQEPTPPSARIPTNAA